MNVFLCVAFVVAVLCPLVKTETDIFLNETFVADYLPIDSTGKYKLFFWLFKSRDKNPNAPLVVFLNGGPGSSSEEVVLLENGPFRVTDDLSLTKNPHSYTNHADVLYLDQPIGTGFSTCSDLSRIPKDQSQVATDLAYFFTKFYAQYPEYAGRRVFFTGQSFAGHYIPGVVPHLIRSVSQMNLKGVSIGNPAISLKSYVKSNAYAKFALKRKMIGTLAYIIAGAQSWICDALIGLNIKNIFTMLACGMALNLPLAGKNRYDYTTTCKFQPDCYDFSNITQFLKKPEVLKRLNSEGKEWVYTSTDVNNAMLYDNINDYSTGFTEMLQRNIPVTLYYGEKDYICNFEGGLEWLKTLNWEHTNKLVAQKEAAITGKDKEVVGTTKGYYLFNFVRIRNASHFVTMDRPELAPLLMEALVGKGVYKFVYNKGIVELAIGAPEQKLRFLVASSHKNSWIAGSDCTNCGNYVKFDPAKSNSTNFMGTRVEESYPSGVLRGELVYELLDGARVPFVLAKEAPVLGLNDSSISGIFSVSIAGSNALDTLYKQGKLDSDIAAFYGKEHELSLGGYNEAFFNKTDIFWVNTTSVDWTVKLSTISFDHTEYSSERLQASIMMEYTGVGLPQAAYDQIFSGTLSNRDGCKQLNESLECDLTQDQLESLPRFSLWLSGGNNVVIHPKSYVTSLSDSKYKINVQSTSTDTVILGGDALNRVYVILHAQAKKIGFVNYDKDTETDEDDGVSLKMFLLLLAAGAIAVASIIVGVVYYFTRKNRVSKDSSLLVVDNEAED